MNSIDFLLLIGSCVWVTWVFVQATIMDDLGLRPLWEKIDFFKRLFNCSLCCGSHVGIYWGLFCFWLNHIQSIWFYILTIPFTAACVCFLYERLMFRLLLDIEKIEEDGKKVE